MSKPRNDELQTIDPTALSQVAGGAKASSGGGDDAAVMTALTGILDSLKSIATPQNNGFGAQEAMIFMMMMQQRNAGQVVAAAPAQPLQWTWDANGGYWIVK